MYHRPSHRQAHTPTPGYGQGYGGYTSPPPTGPGGGYPGYSPQQQPPPQRGPPPGADPELWHWFSAVDTDRSGSITVTELQSALVNGTLTFLPLVLRSIRHRWPRARSTDSSVHLRWLGNWTSEFHVLESSDAMNLSRWARPPCRSPRVDSHRGARAGLLTQAILNLPQQSLILIPSRCS
jgi:hypothetical protein